VVFDAIPLGIPTSEDLKVPVFYLQSTAARSKQTDESVSVLAAPTLVTTLGAAVIAECEVRGLDAQLFVTTDSHHYAPEAALALEPIIQQFFNAEAITSVLSKSDTERLVIYTANLKQLCVSGVGGAYV